MTDRPDLDELERLAREATPGPWSHGKPAPNGRNPITALTAFGGRIMLGKCYGDVRHQGAPPLESARPDIANAQLVVACSPDRILAWIEYTRELERKFDFLERQGPRWMEDLQWGAYKGALLEDGVIQEALRKHGGRA